jgi:hypothetical protein
MSIEIEIQNGDESWSLAEGLFKKVWPVEAVGELPWGHIRWADADLRVMIEAPDGGLACHVGIFFRNVNWRHRRGRDPPRLPTPRLCQHLAQRRHPDHARPRCRAVRASVL